MTDGSPWLRLDARMLLVHPIDELRKYVVPLVAAAVFGASQGGGPLVGLVAVLVPVGLGVVRYLTTSYRIADGRVELRRGLLNRQRLATPVDRVRTVDLTASLVHRRGGLTTVRIGTGGAGNDDGDRRRRWPTGLSRRRSRGSPPAGCDSHRSPAPGSPSSAASRAQPAR